MPYKAGDKSGCTRPFDAIHVGDSAEFSHVLTEEDVAAFASLTGDFNPLHMDEAYAQKTSFRKPVAHGMLSAAFISTMIGMLLPGTGALWVSQTIDFVNPAFVGDTIHVTAQVRRKSIATRMIVLQVEVKNQNHQVLIFGQSTVKMVKMEEKSEAMDKKKCILITGASRGIGAAIAHKLAEGGHLVIVNYLNSYDKAQVVVDRIVQSGGSAIAIKGDVADPEDMDRLFSAVEQRGEPVTGLVHCAAPENAPRPFEELSWEDFQKQIDVNIKGAYHCVKRLLPGMIREQSGDIVLLGSIYAEGMPPVQQSRYVLAKSGLSALARSLAVEYGPKGIRVNIVAPGMTNTDMIVHLPEKVKMLTKMQTPLRRIADPVDIANIVAFLMSPAARHITGESIRVSGGAW
jgi:3-oxoacyl-[acyl-carrier protein] reductase